tara:strand:+ start:1831 stop:2046 length:216 start_codon:yes stop_codon:yes gene_type:complete
MKQQLVQPLPENKATRIKLVRDIILDLADSLETKDDLWEAWKECNRSMSYLSAKHTIAETKEDYLIDRNKD